MRILVTGGYGAVGSFVTSELLQGGHEPLVFSRSSRSDQREARTHTAIEHVQGSILNPDDLLATYTQRRIDRVIHLAALLDDSQIDPYRAVEVNIRGTSCILEAARQAGLARVVYASSKRALGPIDGIHGHPTYTPVTEAYVPRPRLMYDITKFASETIGANFERVYGVQFVALRFAQMYGPGKAARSDAALGSLRSKIVENAMLGMPVRIPAGADGRDDCVYVRDVARGIVQACLTEHLEHRLFHLGTGRAVTLGDFARAARRLYPSADIEIGPGLDYRTDVGYRFECVFDISRARRELGFEPRFDVFSGVTDYVETLLARGVSPVYVA